MAGRIEGETHILPVRVYFEDTDFTGLVYHANFLKFCERGRSDFIRLLGIDHQSLAEPKHGEPAVFVVRRIEIDFLKPARIDEVLEVVTHCAESAAPRWCSTRRCGATAPRSPAPRSAWFWSPRPASRNGSDNWSGARFNASLTLRVKPRDCRQASARTGPRPRRFARR